MKSVTTAMFCMKKQILKELMEINGIPPSYFLLGKEANRFKLNIGLDDIVSLVDISTNDEGDIVIRPNEASIAAYYHNSLEPQTGSCKSAVMIKKVPIVQKCNMSPRRKINTAGNIARKPLRHHLTPIKSQPTEEKKINSGNQIVTKCASNTGSEKRMMVANRSSSVAKSIKPVPEKTKRVALVPKIKIRHEALENHNEHPINILIKQINEVLALAIKLRTESSFEKTQQFIGNMK